MYVVFIVVSVRSPPNPIANHCYQRQHVADVEFTARGEEGLFATAVVTDSFVVLSFHNEINLVISGK